MFDSRKNKQTIVLLQSQRRDNSDELGTIVSKDSLGRTDSRNDLDSGVKML